MKLLALLLPFWSLLNASGPISSAIEKNGWLNFGDNSSDSGVQFQQITAHADMGFYAFSYGAPNTYAFQSFNLKLRKPAWLGVTDCFCPGDKFQLFDNGYPVLVTSQCPDPPTSCDVGYEPNAWACLHSPDFCHATALLDSGHHNLTIAVITSLVGGGAGFLRIDTICPSSQASLYDPSIPPPACCMLDFTPPINYVPIEGRLCNQMVYYPN